MLLTLRQQAAMRTGTFTRRVAAHAKLGGTVVTLLAVLLAACRAGSATMPDNVTVVDVLAVYTSQAREGAGGTSAMDARLQQALLEANSVFQNSRANVRVRLVGQQEVNYPESGSVATDLERLRRTDDGWLDQVHTLRDAFGADLVCLVTETGTDWDFYGLQGPSAANAFSVLRRPFLTGYNYLPVVLSFNFGCQLDRPNADSVAAYPFSFGHTFDVNGTRFGTVEGFSSSVRLPWFSNPEIIFQGAPSGVPAGQAYAADNTRTLNLTAPIVAAFRGGAATTHPPTVSLVSPATDAVISTASNLVITAAVSDSDGFVTSVGFFADGQSLGSVLSPQFAFTATNVASGPHHLVAIAVDDQGATSVSEPLDIFLLPGNDGFAHRTMLAGESFDIAADTWRATSEPGEASLGEPPDWPGGGRTLWWSWTAPAVGMAELSLPDDFNAMLLGVFAGGSLTNLTLLTNAPGWQQTRVPVVAGQTLQIVADDLVAESSGSHPFTLRLQFQPRPPNDNFADRLLLAGRSIHINADSTESTRETDEPEFGGGSVWWKWVAPASGILWITNANDSIQQAFALYAGDTLANLVPIPPRQTIFGLEFDVVSNEAYMLVYAGSEGAIDARLTLSTVALTSPAANPDMAEPTRFVWPVDIALAATVGSVEQPVIRVDFFAVDEASPTSPPSLLARASASPYSGVWSNTPQGDYQVYAQAVLDNGESTPSKTLAVAIGPANDQFASAPLITDTNLFLTGNTRGATAEPGEPASGGPFGSGPSVWWRWLAPASGRVLLTLNATQSPRSLLAVYTGTDVTGLTELASNNDSGRSPNIAFDVRAGRVYQLCVASVGTQPGEFMIQSSFTPAPSNDDFANATWIAGETQRLDGNIGLATLEADEPQIYSMYGRTLWWRWTAPLTGSVALVMTNDSARPLVSVFAGTTLTNLTRLADNRQPWYQVPGEVLYFQAVAGEIYAIQVCESETLAQGPFEVDLAFRPPPTNDNLVGRALVTGVFTNVIGANHTATLEPDEPSFMGASGATIWWSYFAPTNGRLRLRTDDSSFSPRVRVYSGTSMTNLRLLASNIVSAQTLYFETSLFVTNGQEYLVAVDGAGGERGNVSLTLRFDPPPPNDQFSNGSQITGSSAFFTGNVAAATAESGEPTAGIFFTGRTAWWTWTSPVPARVSITRVSGGEDLPLAVFRGSSLSDLEVIDVFRDWLYGGARTFLAEPDVTYHFSIHAWSDILYGWGDYAFHLVASGLTLTAPTNGATSSSPGILFLEAATSAFDGPQQRVEFYAGGSKLGEATQPPWRFLWTNPPVGTHTLRARAVGTNGITRDSQLVTNTVILANDRFLDRLPLVGAYVSTSVITAGATTEPGEPALWSGGTVWRTWTAPISGTIRIQASYFSGFTGPGVAVFTGGVLANLQIVASAANGSHWRTTLDFNAVAGTTYQIVVAQRANFGNAYLEILSPLLNDSFTNRTAITGNRAIVYGLTLGATCEAGEPVHAGAGDALGQTIWWSWIAPSNGMATVSVEGTDSVLNSAGIVPVVAVYTGVMLSNLVDVASAASDTARPAAIRFSAVAGETYAIAVDLRPPTGVSGSLGFGAGVVLRVGMNMPPDVTLTSPTPGVTLLKGTPVSIEAFAADADGLVARVDFFNGSTWLGHLTNPPFVLAVANLPPGPIALRAEAMDDLGGVGVSGVTDIFMQSPNTPNDRFDDGFDLDSAALVAITGNTTEATKDQGEPNHGGISIGRSLWWEWTAPADGVLRLCSTGSVMTPVMAVYTGDALSNLVLVAATPVQPRSQSGGIIVIGPPNVETNLAVEVAQGVTYLLALDAPAWTGGGEFIVDLNFSSLRLAAPVENVTYLAPTDVYIAGTFVEAIEGPLSRLDFYAGTNFVGSGSAPGFNFIWSNAPPGRYLLRAVATNATGRLLESFPRQLAIGISTNDPFASRISLEGTAAQLTGNNIGATREPGEPPLPGGALGQTLWWSWTASANGAAVLSIPTNAAFRPVIAIFTGTALTNLSLVASNSYQECDGQFGPCWWRQREQLVFDTTAGTTYFIALDGYTHQVCGGPKFVASGAFNITLNFWPAPANDAFIARTLLTGDAVTKTNVNLGATREPGEPAHNANTNALSVWYQWTPPFSGKARISGEAVRVPVTLASAIGKNDVIIIHPWPPEPCTAIMENPPVAFPQPVWSVFTGSVLTNLAPVAFGTNVEFDAIAGQPVNITASGPGDSSGAFVMRLRLSPRPANDDFANRLPLWGSALSIAATNNGATRELGEPQHGSATNQFRSVWWTWTAPAGGTVRVRAWAYIWYWTGSWYDYYVEDLSVRVYLGSELASLIPVTGQNYSGEVSFYAQAGSAYQIAVVSVPPGAEYEGEFTMSLEGPPEPPMVDAMNSQREPDGSFRVGIAGQTGQSFVLQVSSDLLNWENLATDTVIGTLVQLIDVDARNYPHRFYRVAPLDSLLARQPLRIRSYAASSGSAFGLTLQGNPGEGYILQASTNLVDWIQVGSGIIYGNTGEWTDPDSFLFPARFYRLLAVP